MTVVDRPISDEEKRKYMDMAAALNADAPEKGIEFSIVKRDVCRPFVYPTPLSCIFQLRIYHGIRQTLTIMLRK